MIDVNFNFFSDVREGQDPDSKSPTLRNYHKLLWSKPLPSGKIFELEDNPPELSKNYLYHKSEIGYFVLGSDAITHSYRNHKSKNLSKGKNYYNNNCYQNKNDETFNF